MTVNVQNYVRCHVHARVQLEVMTLPWSRNQPVHDCAGLRVTGEIQGGWEASRNFICIGRRTEER